MDRQSASDALEVILMAAKGEITGSMHVNNLEVELMPDTPAENVLDAIVTLANDALKHGWTGYKSHGLLVDMSAYSTKRESPYYV